MSLKNALLLFSCFFFFFYKYLQGLGISLFKIVYIVYNCLGCVTFRLELFLNHYNVFSKVLNLNK